MHACNYRYRSIESVGPAILPTELKHKHPQLPELGRQTPQTSQINAPSVKVDEGIDDEDSNYY